jgi:hypothetical protein|tara:strand:- start:312 stop:932 length:621 start_codon:yes stop_codon:yes gene_type:complete
MTVPLASDQSASTQGVLMPKLKYRFRVMFENFGAASNAAPVTELTKQVIDFARPSVEFAQIDIPIYNSTIKMAGKHTWADVTCNLRDDAGANVQKLVGEQLQKQLDFMEMASASAGIDYKFITKFEVLDGGNGAVEPIVLESWELYGCYLKSVNYGDANYGSSEAMTIALTITFDNANQIIGGGVGSAGTLVGRAGDVATGVTTGL